MWPTVSRCFSGCVVLARYSLLLGLKATSEQSLIVFILLLWISGTLTGARFFSACDSCVLPPRPDWAAYTICSNRGRGMQDEVRRTMGAEPVTGEQEQ
jgi:hypothetical protein